MKDKTLHAIYLFFVTMGAILVGVSVFAIRAINRDAESSDWVNQTHATIYELDGMMSELQAGEGMMRTYALTGEVRDFTDCRSSYFAVLEHHAVAQALTRDNPAVQSSLAELEATVKARIALASSIKEDLKPGAVKRSKRRCGATPAPWPWPGFSRSSTGSAIGSSSCSASATASPTKEPTPPALWSVWASPPIFFCSARWRG